jgi:hypothetical protein
MRFAAFLLLASSCFAQAHYGHDGTVLLPDPRYTPGAIRSTNTKEVCSTRASKYRHTTLSMKRHVCAEYGVLDCPDENKMEIDHLIPLELGGADEIPNLWVEPAWPRPGFHEKDRLENFLRRQVCSGKIRLADAQKAIRVDWWTAYQSMRKTRS